MGNERLKAVSPRPGWSFKAKGISVDGGIDENAVGTVVGENALIFSGRIPVLEASFFSSQCG